ncbi:hypothetical protein L484_007098 [Morus notabilis]|uniref:Uncharacterized protein n=1 Tax=Morus notabilis TaxID=981085 RepID=W9SRH8_9ROSA|nr:hypothetical protein L484_007098 [Morus notabilis]
MPCELFDDKCYFAMPHEVVRILSKFCDILALIRNKGGQLHLSLDHEKCRAILDFLGVDSVKKSFDWNVECIKFCNLLSQDSVDIYVELLCFVAENEKTFPAKYYRDIPLLKYSNQEENVQLCSISQIIKGELALKYALDPELHLWLNDVGTLSGIRLD